MRIYLDWNKQSAILKTLVDPITDKGGFFVFLTDVKLTLNTNKYSEKCGIKLLCYCIDLSHTKFSGQMSTVHA